jgi:signal transduction histidine kinase
LPLVWDVLLLAVLAFSFLSLAAFGVFLIAKSQEAQRFSLLVPLLLAAIWGLGLLVLRGSYPIVQDLLHVANVWTRYVLGVPAAILASAGLIFQQREFRLAGMARFGRDSLWAAIAFLWYGLAGQTFPPQSPLPPSNIINQELFLDVFGFPVQLLRAFAAGAAAIFIIRVLRSFEEETRRQIAELQSARLMEAQRRETLRGEMLRRIVSAQEAERQRIARELHDETGQSLTALGLGLQAVSTSIESNSDKAEQNLNQLQRLVEHALVELQRLIADLRPSHLDDLGLDATLRWYSGEIQNRLPLRVTVSVSGNKRDLPSEIRTTLFRIAQEALTNVIKHANADTVEITLGYESTGVKLQVRDDGSGFDRQKIETSARPSWGLVGIEERTALLGGEFRINSILQKGTSIEVFIPYSGQNEGEQDHDDLDVG